MDQLPDDSVITVEYLQNHPIAFRHPKYPQIFYWNPATGRLTYFEKGHERDGAWYEPEQVAHYLKKGDWTLVPSECEAFRSDLRKWINCPG